MRSIENEAPVYLYTGALDMRVGFERLCEKVRAESGRVVMHGGYYVFMSRCRSRVKILYWGRDGYALWHKRLEAGTFKVERKDGYEELVAVDLEELLRGVEFSRIQFRKSAEKGLYSSDPVDMTSMRGRS